MSSTERDAADERELRRFFRDRLVPAADRLRARGVRLYAPRPDPSVESYWVRHEEAPVPFVEIEPDRCEALLAALWRAEGHEDLAALTGDLFRLASRVAPRDEDDEVSPNIYVMF